MAWAGKLLRVDLTAGTCKSEPLNMKWGLYSVFVSLPAMTRSPSGIWPSGA